MDQSKKAPPKQPTHRGTAYADMPGATKAMWIAKVLICACTFGFAFPTVMED